MKKISLTLLALLLMAILGSSKVKANTTVKVGVYQNRPLSFIEKEGEREEPDDSMQFSPFSLPYRAVPPGLPPSKDLSP